MGNILKFFELLYYIAFIILTIGLFWVAIKTYFFQSKKLSELYCKCVESDRVNHVSNVYLEIFNYGNCIAKNIGVQIQGNNHGQIEFLKPNESYKIYFGFFIHALDGKHFNSNIIGKEENIIKAILNINGDTKIYELDMTIIKNNRGEFSVSELKTIADSIKDLTRQITSKR